MATKTKATKTSRKATKAPAKKTEPEMVKLSAVYATVASRKSINTTDAAKRVRGKLRANFDKVCELSPNVTSAKTAANDGNRWPSHVTRELAGFLLGDDGSVIDAE